MIKFCSVSCFLLTGLSLGFKPAAAQVPSAEARQAITDTVAQLFTEITEATNTLDFDRLLGYYRVSDDLTYVAQGRITRSHRSFAEIMDAQFKGLAGAELRWLDTYVDVLSRDVAVATATFEFTATLPNGDTAQSAGSYMCIYVRHDGRWQIQYSAHSFPPRQG
jgi:uncharacterized protein (TIGR02246 family)